MVNHVYSSRIEGSDAGAGGFVAQGDGQVGLTNTSWADQDQTTCLIQEREVQGVKDLLFWNTGRVVKVKVVDGFEGRKSGLDDTILGLPGEFGGRFVRKQSVEKVLVRQVFFGRRFQRSLIVFQAVEQIQIFQHPFQRVGTGQDTGR